MSETTTIQITQIKHHQSLLRYKWDSIFSVFAEFAINNSVISTPLPIGKVLKFSSNDIIIVMT